MAIVRNQAGPAAMQSPYGAAAHSAHVRQQLRRTRSSSVDNVSRRLRDILRSEIFSGAFRGGVLPREAELMLRYDVRRSAVRRALAMLRDEGVVERVQGLGTFAIHERYVADMKELHAEVPNGTLNPQVRSHVLDRAFVPAPDPVAGKLHLAAGEQVLRLEYVATVNREPMGLATNYVAFPEAEAVAGTPFVGDWYTLLSDAGVGIGGTEWVLSSVNADEIVASHLEIAPGTAVTLGEEMIWNEQERPYDFAVVYIRTDRYAFSTKSWSIGARDGRSPLASTAAGVFG